MLVDPRVGIVTSVNETLVSFGFEALPPERIERIIGPPLRDGFALLLAEEGGNLNLVPQCVVRYREHYDRIATCGGTVLQPGIRALLDAIGRVATLAVATSKPLRFAEPILMSLGIRDAFAVVCGPTPEFDGESKTATLRRAIVEMDRKTRSLPRSSSMVGDRYHDIEAAIACGMVPIGVAWGFGSERELRTAGAAVVAHDCDELTALLLEREPA